MLYLVPSLHEQSVSYLAPQVGQFVRTTAIPNTYRQRCFQNDGLHWSLRKICLYHTYAFNALVNHAKTNTAISSCNPATTSVLWYIPQLGQVPSSSIEHIRLSIKQKKRKLTGNSQRRMWWQKHQNILSTSCRTVLHLYFPNLQFAFSQQMHRII